MKLAFDSRQPRSSFHAPKVSGAPKAAGVNDENPTEVDVWTFFSRLCWGMWDLGCTTRNGTHAPTLEVWQSFNHWTPSKVAA